MNEVFLLWHIHELDGVGDEKFIGVYRTEADAKAAIERLHNKPGFTTFPNGFKVCPYKLNQDHWTDGFVTVTT